MLCLGIFFFILITVLITFISHRTKCSVLLAFLRAFCPHMSIKRFVKDALLQVYVRFEVLQWRLSPWWVTLHSTLLPVGPSSCYVGDMTDGRKSQSSDYNSLLVRSGAQISSQSTSDRVFVVSSLPPGKCRLSHDRFLPHSSSFFFTVILSFDAA